MSTIHWGDYGQPATAERKARAIRGPNTVRDWHQALSHLEINRLFVSVGFIGRLPDIKPKHSAFNPQFDKGPGVGG